MEQIHANISREGLKDRNEYRDRIELLRSRISMLVGEDRLLMTMYLENGNSFRQIAQLMGVNDSNISRRIRRLTKRLIDGKYIACLRRRDKFTLVEMNIAKDYFLRGLSMKKIAERRHHSYYQVRQSLKRIQRLVTAIEKTKV